MVDDLPVGQKAGANQFGAENEQPPAAAAGNADDDKPLDERLVSKQWAVRKTAFEQLSAIMNKFDKGTSNDVMKQHASKWTKYLVEPNPGALEKVLECFHTFIDRCEGPLLASVQNSLYTPMIDKCLGAAKPNLKVKAMDCMLLIFEVSEDFGEETMEALQAQLKSKKPKIALCAIQLLAALMTAFGIKKFSPAKFTPQIVASANSSDPKTRTEAMNCYKAIFLWIGQAGVQPFIDPLKEAQKVQLCKDFEALKDKKDFKRKTRTEQEAAKAAAIDDAINAACEEEKEEVIDVFDISAPQEILMKFGPDWATTTLAIKKWNEKKDALDVVNEAANVPKLAPGNYSGLFDVLKKLASDPHIAVAQHAIRAIGNLAKGLRENFKEEAIAAVPLCFAKFKEKRITEDIMTALEHIMMCCELGEFVDNFTKVKTEKNPVIKLNMAVFMERAIRQTYIDPLEELVDKLAPLAVTVSDEKDASTRDQGLVVLGVLVARVPNTMEKYISGLIEAKKQKINAAKETVKISKYDKSERKAAAAAAAAKKAAAATAKKAASKPASTKKAAAMVIDDDSLPGDNVLDEVAPKKPTRAPPNIGKKPVKKADAGDDDEPPKRGGPPARSAKPAAAAGSGVVKVIKADDIKEEEVGAGMGKETAIEKVSEFYDAAIVAKFEEAKWQDKVEGFSQLKQAIEQLQPDKSMVEATCKFIKARMKDWKESNINLMKESINLLICLTQHCDDVPKRALVTYAPFLCDKIGDVKMQALVKEAYLNSAEFCTAKFISVQVVKKGLTAKAPNNLKESCNLLGQLIEDFGAGRVAPKECIDFGIFCCNHANKAVRDASMAMLTTLYKQLGEKITNFLDGVKPSTMQLIQAEFDKATPYEKGEFQSSRQVKGEAAEVEEASGGGGGGGGGEEPDALAALEDALPRADISKLLTAKLIKMFTETDWKLKVKGCEMVHTILKEAQMRIQPDGIADLMEQLKINFKASNKAVLKQVILLMGTMAEAVGQPIMAYNKKCFKPLIGFLGDKAALMRADVIATANKWCEAIGPEHVIQNMCTYLTDGNPEMRNECLKWITAHKAAISKCELPPIIKPLIMCLTDKSGPIRTMADETIVTTMGSTGFAAFTENIRDLKPAVQQTVRPLLEKAKTKMIAANPGAAASAPADEDDDQSPAQPSKKPVPKKAGASGPTKKTDLSKTQEPTKKVSRATAPSLAATMPPPEESDEYTINPGNKERRAAMDSKSKWVFDDIKPQHLTAAKNHSEQIFGLETSTAMWTTDFKKHLKIIEKLLPLMESQPQDLMECVDVIFKWTAVKLAESSNTAFQSALYDFYKKLFDFLVGEQYLFWDHEADVVIPLLCERSGNNNKALKDKVKGLIKMCFDMHDHKKTLLMIVKYGATNKNLKSAGECLDEIATFLRAHNSVPFGEQHIKTIAKLVDSKDPNVRENAIQVLSEIYKVLDEDIWRVMGVVPLKVKGLLETRFKKVKGLGSSTSTAAVLNKSKSRKPAASPKQEAPLTKSFNPGLKGVTPREQSLKFNPKGQGAAAQQDGGSGQQQTLTRSFRPGTSSQSNLKTSGFGQQRPQTAMNQTEVSRSTMPPPTSNSQFGGGQQYNESRMTQAMDFHPPQNEMHFMDDDEDLRQQIQELEGPKKEALDPETQRQVDDIMKFISNLKYSTDLNKRVESLIALNDIIQAVQKHEKSIQHTANDLISAFTHVLIDIFERPRQDTPLRFAKYFVTIVNKTCQCPTIMMVIREQELYELNEQLLTRLLIDNLDKLGDEKEGEFILKNLNGSMLRCLENCNKTSIFCVLFNLLRRYKDNPAQVKLPGLIIKCLLKLSKILEKVITDLEIERILLVIHLYLISINHEQKTSNDEMGIRIVKTLVHEMVKVKRHSMLESYRVVEAHEVEDKHLQRWIKIILNTMGPDTTQNSARPSQGAVAQDSEGEINAIIAELKNTDEFQQAIPKLHNFLSRHPHLSLDYYIRDLSAYFQSMIRSNLESFKNQYSDSGSTPNGKLPISQPPSNPQDRPSFASKTQGLGISSQASDKNRFNYRPNASSASNSGFQEASQASSSKPISSRNVAAAQQPGTGADSTTSTDRINSYQSKLSSMREKFQQRKTLSGVAEAPNKSQSTSGAAGSGGQSATKNFNASFSAMNTSLQQRWKAVQTKGKTDESGSQMANTMVPNSTNGRFSTEVQPKTSNLSTSNNAQGGATAAGGDGASNQELNKRLLELRSKLATLRK